MYKSCLKHDQIMSESWMHVWMHVWMYALMHSSMHAWMYALAHVTMHAWMYAWMHGCMHGCMHKGMHGCMHEWMYRCMHEYIDACLDACMHRCMNPCMHPCISFARKRFVFNSTWVGTSNQVSSSSFEWSSSSVCSLHIALFHKSFWWEVQNTFFVLCVPVGCDFGRLGEQRPALLCAACYALDITSRKISF